MADIGTTYQGQRSKPGDAADEKNKAARIEDLRFAQQQQASKDDSEKDLTAPFNEAVNERLAELGGKALDPSAMDAGIMAVKQRAAAAVEHASLSPAERQANLTASALADVLVDRGIVPDPPSPSVDDLLASDPDDEETFIDEAGDIWSLDAHGAWTRMVDEDAEDEPEDQWPNYTSTGNEGFVDLTDNDEEEDYDSAA